VVVIIAGVLLLASDEDTHRPGKDAVDG
jgi:hypothetical protein